MIKGMRTVIYPAGERLGEVRDWYAKVLGFGPYFDQPFYVGFNVGGFELGLDPNAGGSVASGVVAFWGVDEAEASFARLLELGATAHAAVQEVGEGIKVATVRDPFGNLFGIIENPQFDLQAVR